MSLLLSAQHLSLAFGWRPLLDDVSFSIDSGDRIALLGRNGEGKSTLLNVLRGAQQAADGEVKLANGVSVAYLPQDPPAADERSVREVVAAALAEDFATLAEYETLSQNPGADGERLHALEERLHARDGWHCAERVEKILQRFELDGERPMSALSGGWRRRVWLARVLVAQPQILLLDEPTNHLDMGAIRWLENLLNGFAGAVVFVTHDRAFLQNVANRIWQLDRGRLLDVRSNYERFLRTREELLHAKAQAQERFDKKLAEEEIWIRQGIKARRTRNEGRVRALQQLRRERAARLEQQGQAQLRLDSGERSGRLVLVAEDVSFQPGETPSLIRHFSDIIERGEKIGLVGANGVGKTTLLKLLLGELPPNSGHIRRGSNLSVAYFDQLRAQLNPEETLRQSISQGAESVEIGGVRKHVASYLQDFLFPPERWNTPVSALSGGERARLLLARLFSQPANLLVLDEPTNDLDVETLELLEELLIDYPGTVLLVSHDRAFLDGVATRLYVFNQRDGQLETLVGGFSDWLRQGGSIDQLDPAPAEVKAAPAENSSKAPAPAPAKAKLSYKYQRELEALPGQIAAAEAELATLTERAQSEAYSASNFAAVQAAQERLDGLLERWLQLESGEI